MLCMHCYEWMDWLIVVVSFELLCFLFAIKWMLIWCWCCTTVECYVDMLWCFDKAALKYFVNCWCWNAWYVMLTWCEVCMVMLTWMMDVWIGYNVRVVMMYCNKMKLWTVCMLCSMWLPLNDWYDSWTEILMWIDYYVLLWEMFCNDCYGLDDWLAIVCNVVWNECDMQWIWSCMVNVNDANDASLWNVL